MTFIFTYIILFTCSCEHNFNANIEYSLDNIISIEIKKYKFLNDKIETPIYSKKYLNSIENIKSYSYKFIIDPYKLGILMCITLNTVNKLESINKLGIFNLIYKVDTKSISKVKYHLYEQSFYINLHINDIKNINKIFESEYYLNSNTNSVIYLITELNKYNLSIIIYYYVFKALEIYFLDSKEILQLI